MLSLCILEHAVCKKEFCSVYPIPEAPHCYSFSIPSLLGLARVRRKGAEEREGGGVTSWACTRGFEEAENHAYMRAHDGFDSIPSMVIIATKREQVV